MVNFIKYFYFKKYLKFYYSELNYSFNINLRYIMHSIQLSKNIFYQATIIVGKVIIIYVLNILVHFS